MNAARLRVLSKLLPVNSEYFTRYAPPVGGDFSLQSDTISRFLCSYNDLAFGYHFVRYLIKDGVTLPPQVDEPYIQRAYQFERYGVHRPEVVEAISFAHPSMQNICSTLKAFLVSHATMEEIAARTGISVETIRCFEQLFFNIRDRREESLFISNIVYPESRLVELMEGYMKNESFEKILMRSGYHNGSEDIAYFVGLHVDGMEGHNPVDMARRLESSIMTNGYFLAKNGFLNQRSAHGIGSARNLIMASKQGGNDGVGEDTLGLGNMGDSLLEELMSVKGAEMEEQMNYLEALNNDDNLLENNGEEKIN